MTASVDGRLRGNRSARRAERISRRTERRKDRAEQYRPEPDRKVSAIAPITDGQAALAESIGTNSITFAIGPAGTGKTAIAISAAAAALDAGDVSRIILVRPAVDAGEQLGFLPGDIREKMAPFLRPLYDELQDRLGKKRLARALELGDVEIAPVGMMRGRTLKNSFIVIDEAQNLTRTQLVMILTRLGSNSTMVFTGDPDQSDIKDSGLEEIHHRLSSIDGIAVVRLGHGDIVRHPLVSRILAAI